MREEEEPGNGTTSQDVPLPATLTFVLLIGITFFILWLGVFALLKERW